ncbi:hypothetical protein F4779DRAFT_612473 [Xylariaceae sp. FL0662B]|nr:hypothetical protein F4779DRAFT_612473 [Xylariaceae sp. FL0662B]
MSIFESIDLFRTQDMIKSGTPMILSLSDKKRIKPTLPNESLIINGKRLTITNAN